MGPSDTWQIILLVVFLFFSAFFSASETALMSLSKIRIRHMVDEQTKNADLVQRLSDQPSKLLGAILIGNNVVNIGASALTTSLFINYFGEAGVGIATGVMTVLVLIFGEITPKSLAAQNSEGVALKVAKPLSIITVVLSPLVKLMTFITGAIIKLLGGNSDAKSSMITEDELKTIVNVSHEEGVLEVEEKQMIHNVFEFGDSQARDVMTPRTDMIAVPVDISYPELMEVFRKEQFSRIPVYEESNDHIVGMITVKDFMFNVADAEQFDMKAHMRQPFFTYEFKSTSELFTEMRAARAQMAILLDEYGGTSGIVTLEDLVEEIVGEIEDEYDEIEEEITVVKEDEYVVDGGTKIEDINALLGTHIESEHFDTIGGYVIELLGRLPEIGEAAEDGNLSFIIEHVDKNRIEKIRIHT